MKNNHNNIESNKLFGFWIYLMSDCILFATLFAVYIVLKNNIAYGPSGKDIYQLPFIMKETFLLLFSSITYGIATLYLYKNNKILVNFWLFITLILGSSFIYMEFYEFYNLINKGFGPQRSAFLSSFFTLVGTHGVHVMAGLIWISTMIIQIWRFGINNINIMRLNCLSLFWHFLDIIWICVFTIVYLLGVVYE